SRSLHASAPHGDAVGEAARSRRSRAAVLVRRVPRAEHDRQRPRRPADADDPGGRGVYRLLRTPVGAELGVEVRAGVEETGELMVMSQGVQRTGLVIAAVFIWLTQSAIAHHSFAMYDMTKSQSMTGKLTRFIPGGNHAQLVFEVLGDDGKPMRKTGNIVVWGVETGSAASIAVDGI